MKRLALLVALAGLLGVGCSSITEPAAAVVDGRRITADELEREVEIIQGNDVYRQALEESYGAEVAGKSKGTFQTAFVAQVLKFRVYYELIEVELDRRGVKVTKEELEQGAEQTADQFSGLPDGDKILKSFPASYRRQLARQSALFFAAERMIAMDLDDPREFYDEHPEEFETACASHILVSTTERSAEEAMAKAEELLARVEAGEDFATVATEASDDSSKETGGDLGCTQRGAYVEAFDQAVFEDAEVGVPFGPVETEFGVHIMLVHSRELPAYDTIAQEAETKLASAREEALNDFATDVTCTGDVEIEIDPRYGRWDRAACADLGGFPEITLPSQPTTTSTAPPAVIEQ